MTHRGRVVACGPATTLAVLAAFGCSPLAPTAPRVAPATVGIAKLPDTPSENLERLTRLSAERRAESRPDDYVLGEGDLLSVHAVGLDELNQRVRVDGNGTVALPLLQTVPVAGKTLADAQHDLTSRLGEFMYEPQVSVFVEEYRSQQAGVVGAVQHPGLVSLTQRNATILDALSAAGGMTPEASGRIYLIPAEVRAEAAAAPASGVQSPIMLDLKELGQSARSDFFALPVRPGDVVMVPGTGEFILGGWVNEPGSYPLKSALTLRGAVATGGGLAFPADSGRIHIYRLTGNGNSETHEVDYAAILSQRASDVFIHDGDVIEVGSSTVKLVPYAFYKTLADLVHFAAGIRVAP